jgi:AcrR family transcriptional regulator
MGNILSAAEGLFIARSYADVTMDQIASACDITKGAVYYHYPSKEKLYLAMIHADLEAKRAILRKAIETRSGCKERLRQLSRAFFSLPSGKREMIQLIRRDINIFDDSTRIELIRDYQASLPELVEEAIRDGIRDGELAPADPRLLSWHFVGMVEVVLSDYAVDTIPDSNARVEYVLNLFFHGADSDPDKNGESP